MTPRIRKKIEGTGKAPVPFDRLWAGDAAVPWYSKGPQGIITFGAF